jgi:hypothetical protein
MNDYRRAQQFFDDMVAITKKYNVVVITATQTNRTPPPLPAVQFHKLRQLKIY